jgi:hypothetical protein
MKKAITLYLFSALQIAGMNLLFAGSNNNDTINTKINFQKQCFYSAKDEIEAMLSGEKPLDYERAVFITENAYWANKGEYDMYEFVLNFHTSNILKLYSLSRNEQEQKFKQSFTETINDKKEKYNNTLLNWAIYTYITDTTYINDNNLVSYHLPFQYTYDDPFGTTDWKNSQVFSLLNKNLKKGNCYALASLFKIFSERLGSNACISTAPGHVFVVHEDMKGNPYNVELAAKAFPGSGSIKAYTNTTHEAVVNGISMRKLNLKESIGLCLVYLAKGYEHKFEKSNDEFMMQCAQLTLKYDSLNLNAMLLKAQILEEKIINSMNTHRLTTVSQISQNITLNKEFQNYEKLITSLYNLGYREIPIEIKNLILSRLQKDDNAPIITKDQTPNPFKHINSPAKDTRYATLSSGVFDESHEDKGYEQYQRTVFDTKRKRITKFSTQDETYNNYKIDPVVFAWNVDPLAGKYAGWSPYAAVLNNPILYVDPDGKSAYILVYTSGAPEFRDAALTRAGEILSMSTFDPTKDHIYILEVSDFGKLNEQVKNVVADANKNNYGKTSEFAVWSHSGYDGPIGDESASSDPLYNEGDPYTTPTGESSTRSSTSSQLSKKGWDKIDFNFDPNNSCGAFYGCNSQFFAQTFLKIQENVKQTAGQQASAYPSISKTERKFNILGDPSFPTYFVGAKGGLGWKVWFGATQPAIPMKVFNKDGTSQQSSPNVGPLKEDGTF